MKRDELQENIAQEFINKGGKGILHLVARFGKTRLSIRIFEKLSSSSILITYPDNKIKTSWMNEMKEMNYVNDNITYVNHRSLEKYVDCKYDVVVIDEIHLLSERQVIACQKIFNNATNVLGLSGTINKETEKYLKRSLSLDVIAHYSMEQGIKDGIITDYEINVLYVELDDVVKKRFGRKISTEKKRFSDYTYVIDKMEEEGKDTKFLKLTRMRLIQNSIAKLNATKSLISKMGNERVLVFCGLTSIADGLGVPSYHAKTSDKKLFETFSKGEIDKLAVVKIGATGVTYKPLNKVIVNYFDSNSENLAQKINRCMSFEYDNPEKKAIIYIICSNESVEKNWLKKALSFFDKQKINYL